MLKSILAAVTRSLLGHSALEYFKSELIISVPVQPSCGARGCGFYNMFLQFPPTSPLLSLLNIAGDLKIRTKVAQSKYIMHDIQLLRIQLFISIFVL